MKKIILVVTTLCISLQAMACLDCNRQVKEAIFDSAFYPNLFVIIIPFLAVGIAVVLLANLSTKRFKQRQHLMPDKELLSPVPLTAAATVLGIGFGGFIDGIFLHQILQWHEMLSNKIPPTTFITKSVNMFWDGIFHAVTLVATFVGAVLLYKLLRRTDIDKSSNLFTGGLLIGWAVFNILEGLADHHIFKLHNVRETSSSPEAWNFGFLGFSIVLLIAGFLIAKQKHHGKLNNASTA